jgi:hypothetical protein
MKYKPANSLPVIRDINLIRRLLDKIEVQEGTGCWLWTGHKNSRGYGQIWFAGRAHWVHRVAYAVFKGNIAKRLTVDHICFNPACCNPDHLRVMSNKENSGRKKL